MTKVTTSGKGWVVIPAHLRKKYKIKPGTPLEIVDVGNYLKMIPPDVDQVDKYFGIFKKSGRGR